MKVASTIEHLRELVPSVDKRVFGVAEYQNLALKVHPAKLPALYVFTTAESPKSERVLENYYYQEVNATVAVLIVVDGSKDNRGQDACDQLEDIKEEVFKALLGFCPNKDPNSFYSYAGYRLLNTAEASYAIGQVELSVDYAIVHDETDKQPKNLGDFELLHGDVDVINPDKPDGHIDARFQFKDLW